MQSQNERNEDKRLEHNEPETNTYIIINVFFYFVLLNLDKMKNGRQTHILLYLLIFVYTFIFAVDLSKFLHLRKLENDTLFFIMYL